MADSLPQKEKMTTQYQDLISSIPVTITEKEQQIVNGKKCQTVKAGYDQYTCAFSVHCAISNSRAYISVVTWDGCSVSLLSLSKEFFQTVPRCSF